MMYAVVLAAAVATVLFEYAWRDEIVDAFVSLIAVLSDERPDERTAYKSLNCALNVLTDAMF